MQIPKFKPRRSMPKTLGNAADAYRTTQQQRLQLKRLVDQVHSEELQLQENVVNLMRAAKVETCSGKIGKVSLSTEYVGNAKDWKKIFAYLVKTKQWDIIQRRLNNGALRLRWDKGVNIPGIERVGITKVSCTKVSVK